MNKLGYTEKITFALAFCEREAWTYKAGHKLEVFEKELGRKTFGFKDEIWYD